MSNQYSTYSLYIIYNFVQKFKELEAKVKWRLIILLV